MKHSFLIVLFIGSLIQALKAQTDLDAAAYHPPNLNKPSILSLHPYGNFSSRLQGQFNFIPTTRPRFNLSIESANVWAAPVTAFIPTEESVRNDVRPIEYHRTEFLFNPNTFEHQQIDIANDGVLKGFRLQSILPINENSELHIGLRSFLLTRGKATFTLLTGDQFIEWFHSHIAGGGDPFARELFGLDQAEIYYNDRNNREMRIENGDFVIGGLETAYYIYPSFLKNDKRSIGSNIGFHLGTNLSKYNRSMDLGLSYNLTKAYQLRANSWFQVAGGLGILRKNLIKFSQNNLDFGTNDFLGHLEALASYSFLSGGKTRHTFSADFYIQTSYNEKDEFDYSVPVRNGVSEKSWVTGFEHLYKNTNYWSFIYSFERKIKTSFYLQQDLTLNNNPDIQTGVQLSFGL